MLEPCAVGPAVIVGPNTWNFKHAVELLTAAGGLTTIKARDELPAAIRRLLADPFHAESLKTAARRAIASQQGATRATVELLLESMPNAQAGNLANRRAA
jgi:3-deoxy-D-manno-octulosonic-acid transferase